MRLRAGGRAAWIALAAAGCAGTRGGTRRVEITEPTVITAGPPGERQPGEMDDAALFDLGTRAFRAGEFARAALAFDRISPGAEQKATALWNAGLSYERLGKNAEALARFDEYIKYKDEPEAQLHAALAEHGLGRLQEAARRLHALSERPGLPALQKASALVQEAVCLIEEGRRADGELLLRAALEIYRNDQDEPVDAALPAQAEFWLGEAYRGSFREQRLDPSAMDERTLAGALELKAQLLLSAQGHYLRCIRYGDGEWATAAGYHIGDMYEELHRALVSAPLPRGLDEAQRALYRKALREKVRTIAGKAIRIYEETLSAAERVGARGSYVEKTEQALERVRRLLLDDTRG